MRGRPKGSKNKSKIISLDLGTAIVTIPVSKDKNLPDQKECSYKSYCEDLVAKTGFNDTCYNPIHCLNYGEGKCSLLIKKPTEIKVDEVKNDLIETEIKVSEEITTKEELQIKIKELSKQKNKMQPRSQDRIKFHREIKVLKDKLLVMK